MKIAPFEYHVARSIDEGVALLDELGDDARVLAGGQSLVPMMALRLSRPAHLVDLNNVDELRGVGLSDEWVSVRAMTRQREVERSDDIAGAVPLLAEATRYIAHPAIRNRGTVGGSLAHADPSAELPTVALALDAQLVLRSASGERRVTAADYWTGYFTTCASPDEVLVEARFPRTSRARGSAFLEVSRRHGDFAIVAVAACLELDAKGEIAEARLAFAGVSSAPQRVAAAEETLVGSRPVNELFAEAASIASDAIDPASDLHASKAYRKHIAGVLTRRALTIAAARTGGEA